MPEHTIFLHIQKTAGTTLNNIINRQYPPDAMYHIKNIKTTAADFLALSQQERDRVRLLRGHAPFGLHTAFTGGARYFTMLRDPVDRVISTYYFILNNPLHHHHAEVLAHRMSLQDYVEAGLNSEPANFQVRMLSGVWHCVPFGQCTTEQLELAQRNIREYFDVVGLVRRFDSTLLLLKRYYHWRWLYYHRANVSVKRPRKDELSPATLESIRAYNQLDQALFDWAAEEMQAQIAALGTPFQWQLTRFKALNRIYNQFHDVYWRARRISVRSYARQLWQRWDRATEKTT